MVLVFEGRFFCFLDGWIIINNKYVSILMSFRIWKVILVLKFWINIFLNIFLMFFFIFKYNF